MQNEINKNEILKAVQEKLNSQTEKGLKKYGETVNADSYTTVEWIDHLQEELIDALVYAEVIKRKLRGAEYD